MPTHECLLCNKPISQQGMNKHVFSSGHRQHMISLIKARKTQLLQYVERYKKTPTAILPYVYPKPKNFNTHLNFCLGCKSCYVFSLDKEHTCTKFKEGVDELANILALPDPIVDTPVMAAAPAPAPIMTAPSPDSEMIEQLKNQIKNLVMQLANKPSSPKLSIQEIDQNKLDMADDLEDALQASLTHDQENDFELFNSKMIKMKQDQPKAFMRMCRNLDLDDNGFDE